MAAQKTVLIVGGAGAQGIPIVEALSRDHSYAVRVLTRSPDSATAKDLLSLPNVSISPGDASNESDLRTAFKGVTHAFVNINSFALGIRAEIFWGMRIYDIAIESGCKYYIWSALEDALALSGYDEACRVGHYEGKSRVTEWLKSRSHERMAWSVLTTGPYIEMLHELLRPEQDADGTWVFRFPLQQGAVPFVHLDDLGAAVKWLFDNPSEAEGLNLKISVEHATGDTVAAAFTSVTNQPARYESITTTQWIESGAPGPKDYKMGSQYEGNTDDDPTLLTVGQNFSNWWHLYQRSGGNRGLLRTDYGLLDRVLPARVRSVEEWMRKVGYTGEKRDVIKNYHGR